MDFLVKIFKAMANSNRIRILETLLQEGEKNIDYLAVTLSLPYKTAARNVKILEMANLLKSRRWQGSVFYSVKKDEVLEYNQMICEMVRKRSKRAKQKAAKKTTRSG